MKNRNLCFASVSTIAALFGLGHAAGCNGAPEESIVDENLAALTACNLDDGTIERGARLRACEPNSTKKTTICHIPPGNPANAHTLCVGNPAVPAHLAHGDTLGPCISETRCPPPPSRGGSKRGSRDAGDSDCGKGDSTGSGGQTGNGTGGSTGSTGGSNGTGGSVVIVIP
ncbi:MAG: hypothetical protein H7210_00260 [Pyrinomonadaceae bacterium]|nr:hypothetical protein [Phycisphaerales bacterium]